MHFSQEFHRWPSFARPNLLWLNMVAEAEATPEVVVGVTLAAGAEAASMADLTAGGTVARTPGDTRAATAAVRVPTEACVVNRPLAAVRLHRIRGRGKVTRRPVTLRPAGTDFRAQVEVRGPKPRPAARVRLADLVLVRRPDAPKRRITPPLPMETGIRSVHLMPNPLTLKPSPRIILQGVTLASTTSVGAVALSAGAAVGDGVVGVGDGPDGTGGGAGVGAAAAGVGDGAVGVHSGLGRPTGTTHGSMAITQRLTCSIRIRDNSRDFDSSRTFGRLINQPSFS
jgi:hypothetical protein